MVGGKPIALVSLEDLRKMVARIDHMEVAAENAKEENDHDRRSDEEDHDG